MCSSSTTRLRALRISPPPAISFNGMQPTPSACFENRVFARRRRLDHRGSRDKALRLANARLFADLKNLTPGEHTIAVRATDEFDNDAVKKSRL